MKPYDNFRYLYPPRPEIKSPASGLITYERMGFWAQPKLNGSCGALFINGKDSKLMGRHNDTFSRETISHDCFKKIHKGNGYMVLTGEYMNKSKKDARGKSFTGFVIFDILVYNGQYLLGTTFEERQALLDSLYTPESSYDEFLWKISDEIYRVKNFVSGFENLWKFITKIDMYEGWVLKRPEAKLDSGYKSVNNSSWQIKVRKQTKNYRY